MSEVNADGTLLNPHEAILQEVQALTNSLTAEEPEGMEDDKAHPVQAGNGQPAGEAGGGSRPGEALPAWAVALEPAEARTLTLERELGNFRVGLVELSPLSVAVSYDRLHGEPGFLSSLQVTRKDGTQAALEMKLNSSRW